MLRKTEIDPKWFGGSLVQTNIWLQKSYSFQLLEESLGKKNGDILKEVLKVEAFAKDLVKVSKQTFGFIPNGLDP